MLHPATLPPTDRVPVVRLEPLQPSDLPTALDACRDRHARKMLRHRFGSAADIVQHLRRPDVQTFGVWVPDPDQTPTLIGVRYVEPFGPRTCTCGGWITRRYRHRGFGTAALTVMTRQVFISDDVERIVTGTSSDNLAAQAALRAAGFVRSGHLRVRARTTQLWTSYRDHPTI